jgi:hypothetical protein
MGIELKVTCKQGLTGIGPGEPIRLSEQGELQPPAAWSALRIESPGRGTAEIEGRKVRFESQLLSGVSGRLELRGKILPLVQPGREAGEVAGVFGGSQEAMCFNDGGSGDQVVGTWIAEGGG